MSDQLLGWLERFDKFLKCRIFTLLQFSMYRVDFDILTTFTRPSSHLAAVVSF